MHLLLKIGYGKDLKAGEGKESLGSIWKPERSVTLAKGYWAP